MTSLFLRISEEFSDVFFGGTDEFVENFGTIYDLGLPSIEHLPDLSRNKCFTSTRRTVKEDTWSRKRAEEAREY